MASPVRIGARASPLAQVQARQMQAAIPCALGAPEAAASPPAPGQGCLAIDAAEAEARRLGLERGQAIRAEADEKLALG